MKKKVDDERLPSALTSSRSEILNLGSLVGNLFQSMLVHAPLDGTDSSFWEIDSEGKDAISSAMARVLLSLLVISNLSKLDLRLCVLKKMELNGRKYPVELCKGKRGKYTAYSQETGITKTEGQSTVDMDITESTLQINNTLSIQDITKFIRKFATDRKWPQYHTPRNIALAMLGELGELAELFQWKGDGDTESWSEEELDHVGQELADVTIYLIRMSDICSVDLGSVALKQVT